MVIILAVMEGSKGKKVVYYCSSSQGHDRREYRRNDKEVMEIVPQVGEHWWSGGMQEADPVTMVD